MYKLGDKNLLCLEGDSIEVAYPTYDFVLDDQGERVVDENNLYVVDATENLRFRAQIMAKSANNPQYQEVIRNICKHNILFYVNVFCFTYRLDLPMGQDPYVPFVTFPKQDEVLTWFVWCFKHKKTGLVEKSRSVGLSWLWIIFNDWVAKFHKGITLSTMSQKEDDVDDRTPDSLFEKIRINNNLQPEWLRCGWSESSDNDRKMMIRYPDTNSVLLGGVAKGTAKRGGRAHAVGYDEFAHILEAPEILASASELSGCAIFFSTPKGENNEFARMAHDPNINKISFHWTDHPLRGPNWEQAKRDDPRITEEVFAQEYEISYTKSNIGRVFPDFKSFSSLESTDWIHVSDNPYYDYDPNYNVYTCSDLGRDMTYFNFFQIKPSKPEHNPYTDRTVIFFNEYAEVNVNVYDVRTHINEQEYVYQEHITDIRTAHAKDSVGKGWGYRLSEPEIDVLTLYNKKVGPPVNVTGRRDLEQYPIDTMTTLLRTPGKIVFNKRCVIAIQAMNNWSYEIERYEKDINGRPKIKEGAKPRHDKYSHPGKALIYGMQYLFGMNTKRDNKDKKIKSWNFRKPIMRAI